MLTLLEFSIHESQKPSVVDHPLRRTKALCTQGHVLQTTLFQFVEASSAAGQLAPLHR